MVDRRYRAVAAISLAALLGWVVAAPAQAVAGGDPKADTTKPAVPSLSRLHWTGLSVGVSFGVAQGLAFDSTPFAGAGSIKLTPSGPGLSFGATLGTDGPGFLEWSGSVYHLGASRTVRQTTAVSGDFTMTTGTVPTGTISIDTTPSTSPPGASAEVTTSAPAVGGGTATTDIKSFSPSTPAGNSVAQYAYQQTATGGIYSALITSGDSGTSAAYGVIDDQNGIAITGVGVSGWTIRTTNFRDTTNGFDQALMYGRNLHAGAWDLKPKIGVDALRTDRTISQATSYDLATNLPASASLPPITISQTERLRSHYLALMLGTDASRPLGNGWRLDASIGLGRGRMTGRYSGTTAVTLPGKPGHSQPLGGQDYSAMSWIGRTMIGISREVAPQTTASFGVFCNYLSAVPSLTTVASGSSSPGSGTTTTAALSGSGQVQYTRQVVQHTQLTTGIAFGLHYRF
jgi:hypothetical protein